MFVRSQQLSCLYHYTRAGVLYIQHDAWPIFLDRWFLSSIFCPKSTAKLPITRLLEFYISSMMMYGPFPWIAGTLR